MKLQGTLHALTAPVAAIALVYAGVALGDAPFPITLKPSGTISATTPPFGPAVGAAQANEYDENAIADDADAGGIDSDVANGLGRFGGVNRSIAKHPGKGSKMSGTGKAKSNPEVMRSFEGLNFFKQRFANGGNQFSIEPPDQGLCVGNGFVMESVNNVISFYDTAGNLLKGPIDHNTFYGYLAAINRSTGARGPSITDPSCLYDADTKRWFHVVLTLDHVGTTANENGNNHLDLAVSNTSDPTGAWTIYRIPAQNNGTQGTPDHHCDLGFCFGDYPHIGADANGVYLTTNEFSFFGDGFFGVNIYALDKHALASLSSTVTGELLFQNVDDVPAFTVWPAQSAGTAYDTDNGGTEFLLSSLALFTDDGVANQILQWTLTNTQSLNTASPAVNVDISVLNTLTYSVPPPSNQKAGNVPLRDCLADRTTNCFSSIAGAPSRFSNPIQMPDSNDSRMQQVFYANGKLWSALDTGVDIAGDTQTRAGAAYFVINPNSKKIVVQGLVGLAGNNLTYPAVAATSSGRGVMAFTLLGNDNFPSAAYTSMDAKNGAGNIHVAAAGAGPQDGFAGYEPFSNRPRWGDYGAAVVDGDIIWIASEYNAQTCTYAAYLLDPTCGGTRGALGNWSTRITQLSTN